MAIPAVDYPSEVNQFAMNCSNDCPPQKLSKKNPRDREATTNYPATPGH